MARNEAFSDGGAQQSASQILRLAGGWGNVNGPGLFMLRGLVVGSTAGCIFGVASAYAGIFFLDTGGLPFVLGSCAGYAFGIFRWYKASLVEACLSLDKYPNLLRLHLDANYPQRNFRSWTNERLQSNIFRRSWTLQSMLVSAWLTAQPALDEIHAQEETVVVSGYTENVGNVEEK